MKLTYIAFLTSAFFSFVPFAKAEPLAKDSKIAIIGAGASGLTAAYELKQKGYTQVTVFEKEDRVGGKVFSVEDGGQVFELGAIWAGASYPLVDEFALRYGLTLTAEPAPLSVLDQNGRLLPIMDFPLSQHSLLELVQNFFAWKHVQKKFGYLREPGAFFKATEPDLALPFLTFAEKYHISAFAEGFRPFWVACGYGYYEEVPALYVLKLMLDGMDLTFGDMLRQAFHIGPPPAKPLRIVKEGFQEIWRRMAAELPDVRLSQKVTRIERHVTDQGLTIEVSTDTQTETFDRIIVSVDPKSALNFLDASVDEVELFQLVHSYRYILHIFEGGPFRDEAETLILPDPHGTRDQVGEVIALLRRKSSPPLWTSLQLYPWEAEIESASERLAANLSELSIEVGPVRRRVEWSYFPHVDSAALQSGFYRKAAALQGQKGTYWIGGLWNFETVEATAAYARQLVRENF